MLCKRPFLERKATARTAFLFHNDDVFILYQVEVEWKGQTLYEAFGKFEIENNPQPEW